MFFLRAGLRNILLSLELLESGSGLLPGLKKSVKRQFMVKGRGRRVIQCGTLGKEK